MYPHMQIHRHEMGVECHQTVVQNHQYRARLHFETDQDCQDYPGRSVRETYSANHPNSDSKSDLYVVLDIF